VDSNILLFPAVLDDKGMMEGWDDGKFCFADEQGIAVVGDCFDGSADGSVFSIL